jgi:hypothetical protein
MEFNATQEVVVDAEHNCTNNGESHSQQAEYLLLFRCVVVNGRHQHDE